MKYLHSETPNNKLIAHRAKAHQGYQVYQSGYEKRKKYYPDMLLQNFGDNNTQLFHKIRFSFPPRPIKVEKNEEKIFTHRKNHNTAFYLLATTGFRMQNWYEIEKQICYILLF